MECYEGVTMIKTFRGLLADGAQDTIVLHTNNGTTGYRIVKFEVFANTPGTADYEGVTKVYTTSQTAIDGLVDFTDQTLIGSSYLAMDNASPNPSASENVIFDNITFNQDIFVTYKAMTGSAAINYHIELEQVKLDLSENTVATLKNIRNLEAGIP